MKLAIFIEDLPQMLPPKFRFIWLSNFREEDFQKLTNLKQELPVVAMFVNGSGRNVQSAQRTFHRCFLSSFGSFGKWFHRRRFFRNRPIRNNNCLWWPCLLTNRDKMSNLYKGPSKDASYQIPIHLAQWLQRRRFFRNQPI